MDDVGADAFIDASGAPAAVTAGIRAVRPAGTVVLVGSGAESMTLPTQLIQNRELVLTGVFRYANTWPTALALVESGRVELDAMVTGRYPLERVADALDSDRVPGTVKTVVTVS
jgi:L-iditol 2-dehydrogenase